MSKLTASNKGVFVISVTPFHENGAIDFDSLDRVTDFYLEKGATGITVLGMMGEAPKLTQAEAQANPSVVQQIQQKEQQIQKASQPIVLAQTYAIEQLINDYQNVQQQVVQQKKIQLLLNPDAIQWAPDAVNVTDDLVAALNQRVPSVQTTPPAGWRPRQESLATQQTVSQVLLNVAQQQAAQQQQQAGQQPAQQQQPAQPSGR